MNEKGISNETHSIKIDDELINLNIDLDIPKNIYEFINWYCCLANIEPSFFIYSLLLNSFSELLHELNWDDQNPFNDIGVR